MPSSSCLVVALCGLPGAGKTTLASFLLDRLPLRSVNRDAIRAAQFPLCAFSGDEKAAAVSAVKAAVAANCRLGFSSLIDGMTFAAASQRRAFARTVADAGGRFLVLHLDCPAEIARSRVAAQHHGAGDRGVALVDEVARRFESPGDAALTLDATLPLEAVQELAREAIAGLLPTR